MNIYVSNLCEHITDDSLNATFANFGEVSSAKIVIDQFSGYSRGFGFVDMPNDNEAANALVKLNGAIINGNAIQVSEAKPKREFKGSYPARQR